MTCVFMKKKYNPRLTIQWELIYERSWYVLQKIKKERLWQILYTHCHLYDKERYLRVHQQTRLIYCSLLQASNTHLCLCVCQQYVMWAITFCMQEKHISSYTIGRSISDFINKLSRRLIYCSSLTTDDCLNVCLFVCCMLGEQVLHATKTHLLSKTHTNRVYKNLCGSNKTCNEKSGEPCRSKNSL